MLSDVSYERNNIIFYKKNSKLMKNNTFNNVFCNRTFPYYFILQMSSRLAIERPGLESRHSQKRLFFHRKISNSLNLFQRLLNFHKSWLIFPRKKFSTTLLFLILKMKFLVTEIVKRIFFKTNIFLFNNYITRLIYLFQKLKIVEF